MIRLSSRRLSDTEIDHILEAHRRRILSACRNVGTEPASIIIFGSAAAGTMREDSDLDIAVIFLDTDSLRIGKPAVLTAPRIDEWPLDVLCYDQQEFRHRAERGGVCTLIQNEGRVIYQFREQTEV